MAKFAVHSLAGAIFCQKSTPEENHMPEAILDSTDRAILTHLQRDGRIANVDLAEQISLSPSSCLRRTKALEAQGVIAGYRAELDRESLGLGLTVFIELKAARHSREVSRQVEAELTAIPAIVACHLVSGDADFFVEAVVPSLAVYEEVLLDHILAIEGVTSVRSSFALRTVLSRGPLPLGRPR
jgi:Lrp/AsnC family transcriptional regulator, leucine-responsive regulatory protein